MHKQARDVPVTYAGEQAMHAIKRGETIRFLHDRQEKLYLLRREWDPDRGKPVRPRLQSARIRRKLFRTTVRIADID